MILEIFENFSLAWIIFRIKFKAGSRFTVERMILWNAQMCDSSLTVSCDVMSEGAMPRWRPAPGCLVLCL